MLDIAFSSWFNIPIYLFTILQGLLPLPFVPDMLVIRFSNYHYILCRNKFLNNTYIRKFELRKQACHPWSTIRVLLNCIKLIRSLSKSKHIELLWFVHIMHHNSLLCIATKKSRFIWFSHMNMFCTLILNIIGSHYTSMLLDAHIWDTLWSFKHPTKWGVHILRCPLWPLSFIRHDC
jgi:hypothetical protein